MFFRKRGYLSLQDKEGIVALVNERKPISEVAKIFNCHPHTVQRWVNRFEETLDVKRKIWFGRQKSTTLQEDAMLLDAVRVIPITTAQELLSKLKIILICILCLLIVANN